MFKLCLKKCILMFPKSWESQKWTMKYRYDIMSQTSASSSPPPSSYHLCSGLDQAPDCPWFCHASSIDGQPATASSHTETIASQGFTQVPPPSQRSLPFPSQISLPLLSSQEIITCSHFLSYIVTIICEFSINLLFSFHMRCLLF